jgi:hypothetical protein
VCQYISHICFFVLFSFQVWSPLADVNSVEHGLSKTTSVCPSSSMYDLLNNSNTRDVGVNTDIFQTSSDDVCIMFNPNSTNQILNDVTDVPMLTPDADSSNQSAIQLQMTSDQGSFPFLNYIIRVTE